MSDDATNDTTDTAAAIDAATEKTFAQLMVREGLRQRGMSTRRADWASEAWNEAKSELGAKGGAESTVAAMEVAETMGHAQSVLTALLTNIETCRAQTNATLDGIEQNIRQALDNIGDGYLGEVKLWPSLKALCRAAGTLRGNEAVLTATVESLFRSFYESSEAIKTVHNLQETHEAEYDDGGDNADDAAKDDE